jgi:hypothetical protein
MKKRHVLFLRVSKEFQNSTIILFSKYFLGGKTSKTFLKSYENDLLIRNSETPLNLMKHTLLRSTNTVMNKMKIVFNVLTLLSG